MSLRFDFYFKQPVTEGEMDAAFAGLEQADRDLAVDTLNTGIFANAVVTQHTPTADLTVDVSGPGTAYSPLGERMFFAPNQTVDLSVDNLSVSTSVGSPGNAKIVSLFLKFDRTLSDPRTDGGGNPIDFRQDESFQFFVTQGAEATSGSEVPPALESDGILLADITLIFAQTQILNADIDTARRQDAVTPDSAVAAHAAITEDPHGPLMTITGGIKIGASGAPDAQNLLQIISSTASDFMEWEHTINNGRFTWLFDNLPMLEIRAPSVISSTENPYIRVLQGDGNTAYISARGILGSNAGAGNGTRLRIDEAGKAVSFFSGPEAVPVFDVPLTIGELNITPVAILANAFAMFGPSGAFSSVNLNVDSTAPATANDAPFRFQVGNAGNDDTLGLTLQDSGLIGSGGGFSENDATNGTRIRFDDSAKQAFIHSNTLASPTYDVPLLVAGVEPQEDHFSGALTAAQLPRVGDGRFVLAHGHFNGAGATISADHVNFATITRNGAGDYTLVFDQAISDADYSITFGIDGATGFIFTSNVIAAGFDINTFDASDVAADRDFYVVVTGHA